MKLLPCWIWGDLICVSEQWIFKFGSRMNYLLFPLRWGLCFFHQLMYMFVKEHWVAILFHKGHHHRQVKLLLCKSPKTEFSRNDARGGPWAFRNGHIKFYSHPHYDEESIESGNPESTSRNSEKLFQTLGLYAHWKPNGNADWKFLPRSSQILDMDHFPRHKSRLLWYPGGPTSRCFPSLCMPPLSWN